MRKQTKFAGHQINTTNLPHYQNLGTEKFRIKHQTLIKTDGQLLAFALDYVTPKGNSVGLRTALQEFGRMWTGFFFESRLMVASRL